MRYDISIEPALFGTFPQIRLGCLRFRASVGRSDDVFWDEMDNNILPAVREKIEGKEWSDITGVRGSRAAYKAFGRNPGRYRVSSESLLRRVKRRDALYRINSVVDVNNLVSVRSGLSVGSYDLDKIRGPVVMRKAESGEGYTGIGKDYIDMENMLVLADDIGIFGSSMSDSTRAMVTEQTNDVLVTVYCFEDEIDLDSLLSEAEQAFADYADAQDIESWIVTE